MEKIDRDFINDEELFDRILSKLDEIVDWINAQEAISDSRKAKK